MTGLTRIPITTMANGSEIAIYLHELLGTRG